MNWQTFTPKASKKTSSAALYAEDTAARTKSHKQKSSNTNDVCGHCGGPYPHPTTQRCTARGATCNACEKLNHYAKVCRSSQQPRRGPPREEPHQQKIHNLKTASLEESIFQVNHTAQQLTQTKVTYCCHGTVPAIIDSGSSMDTMGQSTFVQLSPLPTLSPSECHIFAYGLKQPLHLVGKFRVKLQHRAGMCDITVLVITEGQGPVPTLLSRTSAAALGVLQITNKVQSENPLAAYPEVTNGIEELKGTQVHLHVDPSIAPVAQKPRHVSVHLRKKVEDELQALLAADIIEPVEKPTPFVLPMVVVPKSANPSKVRLCVDMRRANVAIQRERHPTPTIRDMAESLSMQECSPRLTYVTDTTS